ncbi:MAG: DUF4145 domain-containing protein [Vicinamibacterales bacterium]
MALADLDIVYTNLSAITVRRMRCGHCGRDVASNQGWQHGRIPHITIAICPMCGRPNYFEDGNQMPGPQPAGEVLHLPPVVASLYSEARSVMAAHAPTSATLALRKLLMHVAVEQGASQGLTFQQYVTYFETKQLVPIGAKAWVDHIRAKGNEANHEIVTISKTDADELLVFTEMLLKLIYEFPNRLAIKTP